LHDYTPFGFYDDFTYLLVSFLSDSVFNGFRLVAKKQKEFTMNKQGCKGLECTINGVVYASRSKAAKALGVSRGTIFSFLKSDKTELKVKHFG
jgi:hypothetical protein